MQLKLRLLSINRGYFFDKRRSAACFAELSPLYDKVIGYFIKKQTM